MPFMTIYYNLEKWSTGNTNPVRKHNVCIRPGFLAGPKEFALFASYNVYNPALQTAQDPSRFTVYDSMTFLYSLHECVRLHARAAFN